MKEDAAFYRNMATLYLPNGEVVDKGALWERKGDILVLVDDDRYIEHTVTPVFRPEEN